MQDILETLLAEKDQLEADFQKLRRVGLAAETKNRERAKMLCLQTVFQKAKELAVKKEARKTSEDLCASLQEQLSAMERKCEELFLEKKAQECRRIPCKFE